MITLVNGPYNGRYIDDSGADPIRMCVYDRTPGRDVEVGVAIYLPDADRQFAFWDGNDWQGKLVETIPVN